MNALDSALPNRIHVVGGPGSGKTYVADLLGPHFSVPVCHLDYEWIDRERTGLLPEDLSGKLANMSSLVEEIAMRPAWVSEGAFLGWAEPLLQSADIVIWMRVPWHV